ncbi:MAG TPA: hypothetical protein VHV82_23565 [Sporichthyaceae bacterium]|jgi:hypothetical protein|nr:hypothetical protein [Sporichthyaceae bacterium]
MSDELQFGALHSDDALLDALGGRVPGASMGVAEGVTPCASEDVVARLLAAYAEEIDNRPGPLTELLRNPVPALACLERPLAAVVADPTAGAVPPAAVPIGHPRRRRLAMSRTAAIVSTGALVLGLGGVAAAVTGKVGPFDDLRRAVSSVTGSSPSAHNPAQRVAKLLESAQEAMNDGDLQSAQDSLAQVQRLLPLIADPDVARTLGAELDALHRRLAAVAPALASVVSHGSPARTSPNSAGQLTGTAGPAATSEPAPTSHKAPEPFDPGPIVADPTDNLSTVNNSPVGPAKDDLKNKAKQKLGHPLPSQAPLPQDHSLPPQDHPLPAPSDLPAPVGGLRGPTGSSLAREVPASTVLYNYGGEALAEPDPAKAAGRLAGGARH